MNQDRNLVPNPRRAAAGRLNRMKRRGLTDEGRQRLRAAALLNKPWLFSSGPKTPEGKQRVALNGKLLQQDRLSVRELRATVAEMFEMVRGINRTLDEMHASNQPNQT